MKTFKDNAGRVWTIAINVATLKRVKGLIKVDLLEVLEGKLIERLMADPVLLVDVVYAVCKPEADAAGVTDEQFGQAMAGDAIELATTALLEELIDFFPSRRDRERAKKVLAMAWNMVDKAQNLMDAKLDSPETQRMLEEALESIGGSSGSSPASPQSTPTP